MTKLLVVGGGKMGEAIFGGLIAGGWAAADIVVVEPVADRREALAAAYPGLGLAEAPVPADGALLAVKPQIITTVCASLADLGIDRVLSIAAGIGLGAIEGALPAGTAVVRAMPNTPSLVGRGAAGIAGGTAASDEDLDWAEEILGAVGIVVRVDEPKLDAITGLSGSGPAYVFLIAEALIDAGVLEGLSRDMASALAVQTLLGASELLAAGTPPSELRAAVTSPGGTTAAALHSLESAAVRGAIIDAVSASAAKARAMG